MNVSLIINESSEKHLAHISKAAYADMPLKKDGWQFNWRSLSKNEDALFFKLVSSNSSKIQGMLMLSVVDEGIVYMNNIEVAPHNYGNKGKYQNVAGCLIAFACRKSFELGAGNYIGFLVFESKTSLIEFYKNKYGATQAIGQRMFIDDLTGKKLIKEYLGVDKI